MRTKRIIKKIFINFIIIYLVFGAILFFSQKSMIYYPNNQNFDSCRGFSDYETMTSNGTRFYYKKQSSENLIVYYHGNAGSACDRSVFKEVFENSNSSIVFVEYAGYSNDDKSPSMKYILNDVLNVQRFIEEESYNNIIVYGQSIGSGPASFHASKYEVDTLILVTPFSNLVDLVQSKYVIYPASILLTEKYENTQWLQNFNGNLAIIHGDRDTIIPHNFSQKLFENVPTQNKEYFLIEGKGHNNIWYSDEFKDRLGEVLKEES